MSGPARERERERESASATLTRPITDPPRRHGLSNTLFPKENTRKTTPSRKRPGPSPKGPAEKVQCRPQGPTQTRPYVKPAHPVAYGHGLLIHEPAVVVNPRWGRIQSPPAESQPLARQPALESPASRLIPLTTSNPRSKLTIRVISWRRMTATCNASRADSCGWA